MPPLRLRRSDGFGFEEDILARRRKDAVGKELLSPRHQAQRVRRAAQKTCWLRLKAEAIVVARHEPFDEAHDQDHPVSFASDVRKSFMPQRSHRTLSGCNFVVLLASFLHRFSSYMEDTLW